MIKVNDVDDSTKMKNKVWRMIYTWCLTNELFNGEAIQQCDSGIIGSSELLAEIVDEMKFDIDWMQD